MKKILAYFWVYYICSFIGAIVETFWCFYKNRRIENRKSFIYEYSIPIYGFAGLFLLIIVHSFNFNKWYQFFLIGIIISTIIEYIASLLQEKIFKSVSWDYKDFSYNLNGRVNLKYSILFGILSTILYYIVLEPMYSYLIDLPFNKPYIVISWIIFNFMIIDTIISFIAAIRWEERRSNKDREGVIWEKFDKRYNNERMKKNYPNIIHLNK